MTTEVDLQEQAAKTVAKAEELHEFWKQRNYQWALDRALLMLQYKQRLRPFELITGNEAAVLHSGAISILGGKEPLYRLPVMSPDDQNEIDKKNKSERFIGAIMREVDRNWRDRGHGSWLMEMLHYATLGAVALFPHIVKKSRKPATFHCDIYDPMTVYPAFGDQGIIRLARIYETEYSHAVSMAEMNGWDIDRIKKTDEPVQVINWWEMGLAEDDEDPATPYNEVLIGGSPMKGRTAHKEFSRIPVVMLPMNGVPWRAYDNPQLIGGDATPYSDWVASWGRPIFWMNREIYRAMDRVMTYEAERMRKAALGKTIFLTQDGIVTMNEQEFQKSEAIFLNASEGESASPLQSPNWPNEGTDLLNQLFSQSQRGGINKLALGDLNLEVSGVTLERAAVMARFNLHPYADGSARALSDVGMLFLDQAKRMRFKSVSLPIRQDQLGAAMSYQVEEYTRDDIPDTTHISVELPMLLPDDRMRQATIARTLIPGNAPLSDLQSVAEEVLKVQDWPSVKARMDEDATELSPAIVAVKQLAALRRLIADWGQDPEMAGAVEEAQMALGIMREQFRALAAPREQPASGLQAKGTAPPPSVQPPEERGAGSSDIAAVAGTSSPEPSLSDAIQRIGGGG